jgi:hypothetical protein
MTTVDDVVRAATDEDGVASAAIFRNVPGTNEAELAAAAGIAGPALEGLVAAVADPRHPIRAALTDEGPTWDVRPMNPGGPALRSHLPIRAGGTPRPSGGIAAGVLALAHEEPLSAASRSRLVALAASAANASARSNEPPTKQEQETR